MSKKNGTKSSEREEHVPKVGTSPGEAKPKKNKSGAWIKVVNKQKNKKP